MKNWIKNRIRQFILEIIRDEMKSGRLETVVKVTTSVESQILRENIAKIIKEVAQDQVNRGSIRLPKESLTPRNLALLPSGPVKYKMFSPED